MNPLINKINTSFLDIILNLPKDELLDLYNTLNTEYYNEGLKKNTKTTIQTNQNNQSKTSKNVDKSEFILKTYIYDTLLSLIKTKKLLIDLTPDKNLNKKNN